MSVLCLGDPIVDLVSEQRGADLATAGAFVPHPGGVMANVALAAASAGAQVRLAGGVGVDEWGAWLTERLAGGGVEVDALRVVPGAQTPVAFVTLSEAGEGSYALYGEVDELVPAAVGSDLDALVAGASGLCIGSNTLAGTAGRALTMRARELALEAGLPVIFDPNLRLHRWRSSADAAASANACVSGALLVRCNAAEAELMTGEQNLERAAMTLLKAGARLVVISLGSGGALLRGELRADVPAVPVEEVRSTVGAGDVLTGVLLARLALSGWYPPAAAAALREATERAAAACERWGATD